MKRLHSEIVCFLLLLLLSLCRRDGIDRQDDIPKGGAG